MYSFIADPYNISLVFIYLVFGLTKVIIGMGIVYYAIELGAKYINLRDL